MGFNPLTYARLAEKTVSKQNPLRSILNSVLYTLLTFVNLPYKMRLLNERIKQYEDRINKYDQIINQPQEKTKTGSKFNTLR